MAFTDNCDLYGAVHEDGINLVARHIMRQRPSLFNYATQFIRDHPELACSRVSATIDVRRHGNFLFGLVGPLPLFGVDSPPVALNFCVQIVEAAIDFHPGNVIALPAELNPPLAAQHLTIKIRICGGIDCPGQKLLDRVRPTPPQDHGSRITTRSAAIPI